VAAEGWLLLAVLSTSIAFSLAVIAVVFVSRRMAVGQPKGR
jgi:hypothetical protein